MASGCFIISLSSKLFDSDQTRRKGNLSLTLLWCHQKDSNSNVSVFLQPRHDDGDKRAGRYGLPTGKWEWRKRQSRFRRGFYGASFIHLSLSSFDKGRALDKGRGQVRFSDQLSAWQNVIADGLKAACCLSATRTEHLSTGGLTPNTQESLIQGKTSGGCLHRTVTDKRVMSLPLIKRNLVGIGGWIRIAFLLFVCLSVQKLKLPTTCQILRVKIALD